jgi:hypothetical protein
MIVNGKERKKTWLVMVGVYVHLLLLGFGLCGQPLRGADGASGGPGGNTIRDRWILSVFIRRHPWAVHSHLPQGPVSSDGAWADHVYLQYRSAGIWKQRVGRGYDSACDRDDSALYRVAGMGTARWKQHERAWVDRHADGFSGIGIVVEKQPADVSFEDSYSDGIRRIAGRSAGLGNRVSSYTTSDVQGKLAWGASKPRSSRPSRSPRLRTWLSLERSQGTPESGAFRP